MKRAQQTELLKDLLTETKLEDVQRTSLQHGLAALRARQQRHRIARALALGALPVALVCAILIQQGVRVWPSRVYPMGGSSAMPARDQSGVKLINDEELFALFPGRSLALVGPPGHQELLFLDQAGPPATTTQ